MVTFRLCVLMVILALCALSVLAGMVVQGLLVRHTIDQWEKSQVRAADLIPEQALKLATGTPGTIVGRGCTAPALGTAIRDGAPAFPDRLIHPCQYGSPAKGNTR